MFYALKKLVSYIVVQLVYSEILQNVGFKIKKNDQGVTNKDINDAQCTIIAWNVDDLKVSHATQNVVMEVMSKMKAAIEGNV